MTVITSSPKEHEFSGTLGTMNRMAAIRSERGLSQEVIARVLAVATSQVSRWETGRAVPHPRNQRKLAKLLGVEPEDFGFSKEGGQTAS